MTLITRIIGFALILLCTGFISVGLAQDEIHLISEENGRLVVEVRFNKLPSTEDPVPFYLDGPGEPPLHYARFFVATPDPRSFTVKVLDGSYEDIKGGLPQPEVPAPDGRFIPSAQKGLFPENPCIFSKPLRFRKAHVFAVDCFSEQVNYTTDIRRRWSSYRIEVTYTPARRLEAGPAGNPLLSRLVINKNSLPSLRDERAVSVGKTLQAPAQRFSLSSNWVKITITQRGLYAISGGDLARIVDITSIDPASFRLFTAGGIPQPRSLADSSGTWLSDNWMNECALLIRGGDDSSFDTGDSLIFYGLGSKEWLDYYQPGAPEESYHDHLFSTHNVYFLTWGGSFVGSPLRMETTPAAPAMGAPEYATYKHRNHYEKDLVEIFDYGDDGWFWLSVPRPTNDKGPEEIKLHNFTIRHLDPTTDQEFRTVAIAPYCASEECRHDSLNNDHHAVYLINGAPVADIVFDVKSGQDHYSFAKPVHAVGSFMQEGSNSFTLSIPRDLNPRDFMYFAWFDIVYNRRLIASNDILSFSSPDTVGPVNLRLRNFSTDGSLHVFNVTDPYRPEICGDIEVSTVSGYRQIRLSTSPLGNRKYFWASTRDRFQKPSIVRYFPTELRTPTFSPQILIVCNRQFRDAANILKTYRQNNFVYFSDPVVEVVSTDQIFDNFSGGLHDPMAIRNYCKYLYDNFTDGGGLPLLTFLCLLGDANNDVKNIISSMPDLVPTNLNLEKKYNSGAGAYATDDWFVLMDLEDEEYGLALQDIAVGRLPASSVSEAFFLVDRVIQYETAADLHPWRGKVILLADDEVYSQGNNQVQFTTQSEMIASYYLPRYIDVVKIYLMEFPAISGLKPESRLHFLKKWNEGALVINFIGHGNSQQMADEQVFLGSDVSNLHNGLRLPLFMAMSCKIGNFGDPQAKCLAEKLVLRDGGGSIASITASQESFIGANEKLDYAIFTHLFEDAPTPLDPIGLVLMIAKVSIIPPSTGNQFLIENNQKYNLLGDPTLCLLGPTDLIKFANDDADTLVAGVRKTIEGTVYRGTVQDTNFSGVVHLRVREPDDPSGYDCVAGHVDYRYPRGVIYRGTSEVENGNFTFSFRVPRFPHLGPYIYLTAYAENGHRDAITMKNTINFALVNPSSPDSITPSDGPPRVEMGFSGGLEVIKPGAMLQAVVRDADGINILSTTNEGKHALVFDDMNLPIDVTEFFLFDHGGSDTSGVLRYPLSEISVGKHKAVFKVSDSFGQTTIDTLHFTVTDPLDYYAEAVFNYPNPFSQTTHFLFKLSDPATIHLDVFTLSGRKIRTLEESRDGGEAWVFWDGRDSTGDEIANGVYLYVAKVVFSGLDRPPVVLRGKLQKIE